MRFIFVIARLIRNLRQHMSRDSVNSVQASLAKGYLRNDGYTSQDEPRAGLRTHSTHHVSFRSILATSTTYEQVALTLDG